MRVCGRPAIVVVLYLRLVGCIVHSIHLVVMATADETPVKKARHGDCCYDDRSHESLGHNEGGAVVAGFGVSNCSRLDLVYYNRDRFTIPYELFVEESVTRNVKICRLLVLLLEVQVTYRSCPEVE